MLDINISFEYVNAPGELNERIKIALGDKLVELTEILYKKVEENITGKILQKRSGALLAKLANGTTIDTATNPMNSFVGIPNPGAKEYALEFGGKGYYSIIPVRARALKFLSKTGETVFASHVNHPPSKAFAYLGEAALEMEPLVPEGFAEAVQRVLSGGI